MSEATASRAIHARIMSDIATRIDDIVRRQRGRKAHLEQRMESCQCEICVVCLGRKEIERIGNLALHKGPIKIGG